MRTFAWAGAALFVISLLHFGWRFFYSFGAPFDALTPGSDLLTPILLDVVLFSTFALHHSLLARTKAKEMITRKVPRELERPIYVWIASLLFIAICAAWQPVRGVIWSATGVAAWILSALSLFGAWFTLQSAIMLDVFELAGTRGFMAPKPLGELKSHGPYGLVRHPIYFAWLFLVWTPTTMNGTRLVFAAVSTLYLAVAIPLEERSLHRSLGPAYADYAARVRWRMIPGIY